MVHDKGDSRVINEEAAEIIWGVAAWAKADVLESVTIVWILGIF